MSNLVKLRILSLLKSFTSNTNILTRNSSVCTRICLCQFYSTSIHRRVRNRQIHRLETIRLYSSENNDKQTSTDLTSNQYEVISEETLQSLSDKFDVIGESIDCDPEYDVSYGSGVLTVKISNSWGTYVINKQAPNKQIWLSSPKREHQGTVLNGHREVKVANLIDIRTLWGGELHYGNGPKRYDYINGTWIYNHDGLSMYQLLTEEISQALSSNIDFSDCEYSNS